MAEISDGGSEISSGESGGGNSSGGEISAGETSSSAEISETHSVETSYVDDNDAKVDAVISEYEDVTGNVIEDVPDAKMNELTGDLETQGFVTDEDIPNSTMSELENSLKSTDKTGNPSTPQEVSAKQEESLKDGLNRLENGDNLTRMQKGNLAQIMEHRYFENENQTSIMLPGKITQTLDDKNRHGIDDAFQETKADGKTYYTIVEVKFGTAKLNPKPLDGPQGSWDWVNGSQRLDKAVGKPKAGEIREAYEDDGFSRISVVVYHYNPHPDEDGLTHSDIYPLDINGKKSGPSTIVESFQGSKRVESYKAPYAGRESK